MLELNYVKYKKRCRRNTFHFLLVTYYIFKNGNNVEKFATFLFCFNYYFLETME